MDWQAAKDSLWAILADKEGVQADGLRTRFSQLEAEYSQADASRKAQIEGEIQALNSEAANLPEQAPTLPSDSNGNGGLGGGDEGGGEPHPPDPTPADGVGTRVLILVLAIVLIVAGLFFLYFNALSPGEFSSISGTRPLLVMTLIISMLGFGGLLIVRALYGRMPIQELHDRFRLAREVFLVFAGIFGTIIGFYFGAADEEGRLTPPAIDVAVADRQLTATIQGGAPPFVAYYSRSEPRLEGLLSGDDRILTLNMGQTCPVGGTVYVVDGRGRRADVDVEATDVSNWPGCGVAETSGPVADSGNRSEGNESTNATAQNVTASAENAATNPE